MKRSADGRSSSIGRRAEDAAAAHLASLGMHVVARNLRGRGGEVDIVATDGGTVVFIEVKARSNRLFGSALSAVDARKRRRIRAVAEDYLQVVAPYAVARFDVLTIEREGMTLHRNAFT